MKKAARDKRFFFDLNHPADFHFFKNLFSYFAAQGYSYRVMARDKECLHELLEAEGIPYLNRGKGSHSIAGKYMYAVYILGLTFIQVLRFRPGLTLSLSSPYLITVSRFLRIPTLTYDDTDFNPRLQPALKRANYIFSPANYPHSFHKYHFHIQTYKELSYLTSSFEEKEDLKEGVFFRITRSDSIHHSAGNRMEQSDLIQEINRISETFPTYLSSETKIDEVLSPNVIYPDTVNIHEDMQQCKVFWGNSATMATEAVILGIPAIFIGTEKFAYLMELEEHGLLHCFTPDDMASSFSLLEKLLQQAGPGKSFSLSRAQLLKNKSSMTGLLIRFIENLPESAENFSEHPLHENK